MGTLFNDLRIYTVVIKHFVLILSLSLSNSLSHILSLSLLPPPLCVLLEHKSSSAEHREQIR